MIYGIVRHLRACITTVFTLSLTVVSYGQIIENLSDLRVRELTFHDQNYGLGVGKEGRIIKTVNGGDYWKLIEPPQLKQKEELFSVFIAPSGTSYVGGSDGILLKSTDKGETWSSINLPFKFPVKAIHFSGDSVGLVTLDVAYNSYLFRTKDGGTTWSLQHHGYDDSNFHHLDFPTENTGFMVTTKKLLRTTDRGLTWTPITSLAGYYDFYYDINFLTPQIGFILNNQSLYKTLDGGTTWNYIAQVDVMADVEMKFINEQTGYCSSYGKLQKTIDGGVTWKIVAGVYPVENGLPFYFRDAQTGFYEDIDTGELLKTTDGATKWSIVFGAPGNSHVRSFERINAFVQVQTEKLLFAVDRDSLVWRSDNGGVFWFPQTVGTESLNSIFFINDDTGYLVGDKGTYYKTTNGGASWQAKNTGTQNELLKITFIDSKHGIITGKEGIVLKSNDGGETWQDISIDLQPGLHVYSGGLINERVMFAMTHGGVQTGYMGGQGFYTTNNGGETWTLREAPFTTPIYDGHMADSLSAAAAGGYGGTFIHTSDQGINWPFSNVFNKDGAGIGYYMGYTINSIFFPRKGNAGFATGENGYLLRTKDNGKRWDLLAEYRDYYVTGYSIVRMLNDSTGYLLGGAPGLSSIASVGRISCDLSKQFLKGEFHELCPDQSYYYTLGTGSSISRVEWNVAGGTVERQTETSIEVKWNIAGKHLLTAKIEATNCKNSRIISQDIATRELTAPSTLKGETVVCVGEQYYEVVDPLPVNYTWTVNGGGTFQTPATEHKVRIRWTIPGTYTLKLTSANNRCYQTKDEVFTIRVLNSAPSFPLNEIKGDKIVCNNLESHEYVIQTSEGMKYTWSVTGGEILSTTNGKIVVLWNSASNCKVSVTPKLACYSGGTTSIDVNVTDESAWFADIDGDLYGDPGISKKACLQPGGFVANNLDCNDQNNLVNPNTIWFTDLDGDLYGDPSATKKACLQPGGFVANNLDCNDQNNLVNPNTIWFTDLDGDLYGDPSATKKACVQPGDFVANNLDCDDQNILVNPTTKWYADADGDLYGNKTSVLIQCDQPLGHVLNNEDCDDTDADLTPENDCIILGNEAMNQKSPFNIYPNPCSNYCHINDVTALESIDLIDSRGQSVTKVQIENGFMDVSAIPSGLYFIKIKRNNAETATLKLAVVR